MKIKQLYLKNFKSVEEHTFYFEDGITCFTGDNGEGKSTVIHAMLIMLFNSYDLSFKDYINWNAMSFKIKMNFSHEGEDYEEEFEYSEKTGSKRNLIKVSTNELWENSAAVNKLSEIIDPDLAKASIVSMENEQNLITTTPAKRREYLKGVYNLDFKEQLDTIASNLEQLNKEEIEYSGEIEIRKRVSFEYKIPRELNCSESEYEDTKKQMGIIEAKIGELELQKKRISDIQEKINDTNIGIRRSTLQLSNINEAIDKAQLDRTRLNEEINEKQAEDKVPELKAEIERIESKYQNECLEQKNYIESYKKQISELEARQVDSCEIEDIRNKLVDKNKELAENSVLLGQSDKKLSILKTGKCPTCGHEVTTVELKKEQEYNNMLCEKQENLLNSTNEIEKIKINFLNQQKEIEQQISKIKGSLNGAESYLSMVERKHDSDIVMLNHEIEVYTLNKTSELNNLKTSCKACDSIIESNEQIKAQTEEMLSQYRSNLDSLNSELEVINDPTEAINNLYSELRTYKSTVSQYDEIINYNKWVAEYNSDIQRKEKERDERISLLEEKLIEIAERKSMIERAKVIVMREFPSFVISYMVKSLENYANEFLLKVYPKYQIKITESKNSLAITYGPRNADVKMASGFEKSAFSLAYMYALGKMQKYGLLIIDEGDGAASDEKSIMFYDTVAKSQEFFPQIFCITHKEVAKELLENTYHAHTYTVEAGHYIKN